MPSSSDRRSSELLFGEEFDLDHRTLGLLALANAVIMVAMALSQAVIALHGHKTVARRLGGRRRRLRRRRGRVRPTSCSSGSSSASSPARPRPTTILGVALARRLAAGASPETGTVIEALHELPSNPDASARWAPAPRCPPVLTAVA